MNTIWELIIKIGQIKLFLKKITLKISRITDAIGFYVLNSSHDTSRETSCDASRIDSFLKNNDAII